MTLQFERKFTLILLFVFLILTTIGIAFYQSTVSSKQAIVWQNRTRDMLTTLDDISTVSLDANSSVDSFIITGNDSYLATYDKAKQKIERDIASLRSAENSTDTTKAELDRLEAFEKATFDRLAYKVALRKSADFQTAVSELPKAEDRTLLLNIRASIERAKTAESAQLQAKLQQLEASRSNTITLLILSCVAGIGSLGFANFVVFRETAKRSRAEAELIEVNRGLEERIDERTAELQKAGEERSDLLIKEQKARREAEIANRLRDEFMATVSHELRTPLNSILGWARLMRIGKLAPDQEEKAVETIINSAEIQNRLIEDLLDVARVVSGKLDLDRIDFDIIEMVEGSINTMQPAAGAKRITIIFEHPEDSVLINGDKNRLEQVMLNLLTNAIKFSPKESVITVRERVENSEVEVSVIDQGVGIKPDFLPVMFERFSQDASTAAGSGGLGLGLAIVRNLVEMHRGTVGVTSEGENRGSEFIVRLPLKESGWMAAS
ncbi:MAG: ATP-binding protein [Acidobacteriota bacterium]